MLKLDILVVHRPGMTHDEFINYWRDNHAAFFVVQPIVKKTVRRYVQSRPIPIPANLPVNPYDGIAQLWFDDMAGFLEYVQSPNYIEIIRLDEAKFVDLSKVQLLFSEETIMISQYQAYGDVDMSFSGCPRPG
jgi:uncharacterized protein (TIGR02118 family)